MMDPYLSVFAQIAGTVGFILVARAVRVLFLVLRSPDRRVKRGKPGNRRGGIGWDARGRDRIREGDSCGAYNDDGQYVYVGERHGPTSLQIPRVVQR